MISLSPEATDIIVDAEKWQQANSKREVDAISHIFRHARGHQALDIHLKDVTRPGLHELPRAFLYRKRPDHEADLQNAFSYWFTGSLVRHLMYTPIDDWSFEDWVRDLRADLEGLPVVIYDANKVVQDLDEESRNRCDNGYQARFIRSTLFRENRVGWFFYSMDNLIQLTPAFAFLTVHLSPNMIFPILEKGRLFEESLNGLFEKNKLSKTHQSSSALTT